MGLDLRQPELESGLTIGTTAITGGTAGRVLFEGAGNVVQQDSTLFWDNTNKRLGVGATPDASTRLDVRAQGALSTDIAFRVRNSANTANFIEQRGNGSLVFSNGVSTYTLNPRTDANGFSLNSGSGLYGTGTGLEVVSNQFYINNSSTRSFSFSQSLAGNFWNFHNESGDLLISYGAYIASPRFSFRTTNFVIGGILAGTSSSKVLAMYTGTAPSASITDGIIQYSADIVAGNAAPHFRTENGSIIKLYKEAALTVSDGTLANAVTRIAELEARLQAFGLIG